MRDDAVIGSDWLDAKAFPVSTYITSSIGESADGEFKYVGDGELTIRERSAPVTIEFSWTVDAADANRRQLQGRATF